MIDVLVKLLNWTFNNFERRWGLYLGKDRVPRARKTCPVCNGEGVLEGGDVCPGCHGAGRVET
ncbi:MAG: hypothetical protein LPJ87_10130 [Zoogloeaceae bacterium]|nr:hypothetical protein [Zoogloeaceae bacterium]